jgi:hypothetical protein
MCTTSVDIHEDLMIYIAFRIMDNGTCGVPLPWGRGPPVPTDAFLHWLKRKTWDDRKKVLIV